MEIGRYRNGVWRGERRTLLPPAEPYGLNTVLSPWTDLPTNTLTTGQVSSSGVYPEKAPFWHREFPLEIHAHPRIEPSLNSQLCVAISLR